MKRHLQKTGVRKFFGQDLIDLQAEPLKALDTFFAQYGSCIVQGCDIEPLENDTINIASGLVAIEATDPETTVTAIKVMPFGGAKGVALPLYLTAQSTVIERVYGDGKVKPIAYDYHAVAVGVEPETPFIKISAESNNRFVDVLQDDKHSFITSTERAKWDKILEHAKSYIDTEVAKVSNTVTTHGNDAVRHITAVERTAWNAKETPTGAQTKATTAKNEAITVAATDASNKSAAALQSAKEYANTKDTTLRTDMATADTATLRSAKSYADTIVAALVDNSPEALNTLQELAKALGNDPNFATTVMNEIGKRVKTTDFDTALAGKLDKAGGVVTGELIMGNNFISHSKESGGVMLFFDGTKTIIGSIGVSTSKATHLRSKSGHISCGIGNDPMYMIWDSGNFDPATKADSITILNSDLNTLMKSGIYTVDGDQIQNAPYYSLNWRVFVASYSVYRVTQIAQPWDSDRLFFRRKHNDVWHPWREVYHSGNLAIGRSVENANTVDMTGIYKVYDHSINTPINLGGHTMLHLEWDINAGAQMFFGYTTEQYYLRRKNARVWSPWREIFHSGNLVPATTSANGLMSAGDKAKLDGVATNANNYVHPNTATTRHVTDTEKTTWNAKASTAVATRSTNGLMSADDKAKLDSFIRGSVNADGSWRGTGFEAYKQGNYLYVRHSLGHINYMAVATVNGSSNGSAQDNEVAIISKTSDAVGFLITNGVSGDPEIAAFDFIIMSYW